MKKVITAYSLNKLILEETKKLLKEDQQTRLALAEAEQDLRVYLTGWRVSSTSLIDQALQDVRRLRDGISTDTWNAIWKEIYTNNPFLHNDKDNKNPEGAYATQLWDRIISPKIVAYKSAYIANMYSPANAAPAPTVDAASEASEETQGIFVP